MLVNTQGGVSPREGIKTALFSAPNKTGNVDAPGELGSRDVHCSDAVSPFNPVIGSDLEGYGGPPS